MRIGVLGASQASVESVIGPSRRLGHQIVVVGSRDAERGQDFAAAHSIPEAVASYLSVVERGDLDLVYVGLVNAAHAHWATTAVAHGRHVLVEKPLTLDLGQAQELLTTARASHRHVFDGYHYAHHPMFARVLEIVQSGEIGDLSTVHIRLSMVRPAATSSRWSFELGGGSLLDLGCYGLDACARLAEALGGSAAVTAARAQPASVDTRVDARMSIDLSVAGTCRAHIHCSIDSPLWAMAARDALRRLRYPEVATRGMVMCLKIIGSRGSLTAGNFVLPQLDDRLLVRGVTGARTERLGRVRSYDWQLRYITKLLEAERQGSATPDTAARQHDPTRTAALIDVARLAAGLQTASRAYQPLQDPAGTDR